MRIPANVGAFPEPFLHGYGGERHPVVLRCLGTGGCETAERALREAGVRLGTKAVDGAIRILAGPWQLVRRDPVAALIERGPAASGVFAEFRRRAGACSSSMRASRGSSSPTALPWGDDSTLVPGPKNPKTGRASSAWSRTCRPIRWW